MKLYITPGSPYARIARIVVLEKHLDNRVEVVEAETRVDGSPHYAINPSGRVPYLLCDDGTGLEESAVVCRYLDRLDGDPRFELPDGPWQWDALRLGARATSLLDGLSVWLRETRRPAAEQSPTTLRHEADRARRLTAQWETDIAHPWMRGDLNLAQLTLVCALGLEARNPGFQWRGGCPNLSAWFDRLSARPSIAATVPVSGH